MTTSRTGFWAGVKGFPYGEATLWVLFLLAFLSTLAEGSSNDQGGTLAGVCALAAIGVRITRLPKPHDGRDAG